MSLRFGYFDSDIIGVDEEGMPIFDRAETSDLMAFLFANLVSDGVLAQPATCFRVRAANNGLKLMLDPGFGMIKGHFCYDDEIEELTIDAAPQKYNRIDRVVMRCNYLDRVVEIIIKKGMEAVKPVPPELLRPAAGDYFELCLANIRLTAGQKIITQSNITDTRPDSSVCGYITQLIDHLDTAVFFDQLNKFYEEFVEKSDTSYDEFAEKLKNYFDNLTASGNSQLLEIVRILTEFEADSEKQWHEWFDNIRQMLESVENGKMLAELLALMKNLYNMASQEDIDRILNGTYVDVEDTEGIFEIATTKDIDDIIGGTYIEQEEDDNLMPDVDIDTIVNNAFKEV